MNSNNSNGNNGCQQNQSNQLGETRSSLYYSTNAISFVTKSLLPTRRRLRLDPPNRLFFPYEPGKQVRSAIGIKNTCKSHVAFKFQTTAPKSCYMRPPGAILAPGESLTATVFKFVEPPENNDRQLDQKSRVKFKIMSLKVKGEMEYVPEMFDEQKDQVAVEQILRVIFLDPIALALEFCFISVKALEKLKRQLAEAEAELEARKKPPEDAGPRVVNEGLVMMSGKSVGKDTWHASRLKLILFESSVSFSCHVFFLELRFPSYNAECFAPYSIGGGGRVKQYLSAKPVRKNC
ncbi:Intracellular trafficking, secretion, and vesicular transport [Salix suchowensis]|nr:Intracellular trafficking, secretion, and vesicular transport [Salix suchowensis]